MQKGCFQKAIVGPCSEHDWRLAASKTLSRMNMMKKKLIASLLVMAVLPLSAQKKTTTPQRPIAKRVSDFFKKTKKQVSYTGQRIGEAIGLEQSEVDKTLITIDGVKYMPVYKKDLMVDREEAARLETAARTEFLKKYPKAEIVTSVVPQEDWNHYAIHKKKITGYKRRAYVYILAKDGDDAYLNASYLFEAEREPGQEYVNAREYPQLKRVDAIPSSVLGKLEQ